MYYTTQHVFMKDRMRATEDILMTLLKKSRYNLTLEIIFLRGSFFVCLFVFLLFFCYRAHVLAHWRDREIESEKSPPREDGHTATPSPPLSTRDQGYARTCPQHEFKPPRPGLNHACYMGVQ